MAGQPSGVSFDAQQAAKYEQMVRMANVGYELVFELAAALLRVHLPETAHLLIVGAGGGMELQTFGPGNPRWQFTGVDPSAPMLTFAREKAERHGLTDRVRLVPGTVDDLPPDTTHDAATCIYVEHFLPDDGTKLRLLQGVARRLRHGAAFLLVAPDRDTTERFRPAWEQYSATRGMPEEQRTMIADRHAASVTAVGAARLEELLREAGFRNIEPFYQGFNVKGWIAAR